jgi:RNA polymerase sigma-70 factor, ECF subfamily
MSTLAATPGMRAQLVALLPRLRRFARNLTRNPHDADDVLQIALERALQRSQQWRSDERLDSWMFKIIRNQWIDTIRSRTRQARLFAPAEDGDAVGESSVETLMERESELLSIHDAMARLPDEQREAISLVLIEELPYKEAAAVLEIPIGTLTSRLARGRVALQALLAPAAQRTA